jgi:hypothetical protein
VVQTDLAEKKKRKQKGKFLLKKTEVFLLSRAVESNMIYSDRVGFLDEMSRPREVGHLPREQCRVLTTKEIRSVSISAFSFLINVMCDF